MTAPRDTLDASFRRVTFRTDTPERVRAFRLRCLAMMVHLEAEGAGMTSKSARRQAMEALDIPSTDAGRRTATDEIICRLFAAAQEAELTRH